MADTLILRDKDGHSVRHCNMPTDAFRIIEWQGVYYTFDFYNEAGNVYIYLETDVCFLGDE